MIKRLLIAISVLLILGIGTGVFVHSVNLKSLFSIHYSDFRVSYNGAMNGKFTGMGHFVSCASFPNHPEIPNHPQITLFEKPTIPGGSITIFLRADVVPGTYTFSNLAKPGIVYIASGTLYENGVPHIFLSSDIVAGQITMDTVPRSPGELVQGQFSISIRNRNLDGIIDIQGDFHFRSSSDCQVPNL